MRAYSLDLRQRVMKAYDEGKWTMGQIAERFKVGEWWVHKLKRQTGGGIAPRKGKVGQLLRFDSRQINRLTQYVDQLLTRRWSGSTRSSGPPARW